MRGILPFIAVLVLLSGNLCWGQGVGVNLDTIRTLSTPELRPEELALENAIDVDAYIVGPGDELTVNLWGEVNFTHVLSITPEGTILIPRVGSLYVSGLSLRNAKKQIEEEIAQRYRNAEVTITLTNLRKLKISVTGEVNNPGTYICYANQRISELIEKAGGFKGNASQRNVVVKKADGSESTADVLKFLIVGDKRENPYVLDGEVIYVPPTEGQIGICGIYGAVKSPGEFEYSPNDSLLDLIALAQGLMVNADLALAEIVRFEEDNKTAQTTEINLKDLILHNQRDKNIPLMPDDRVFIKAIPEYREKKQVRVSGEVVYPGVYSIEEEKDKLSDLIGWAGGFTKDASLLEAEVIRGYNLNIPDAEFERLKKIPVADMSSTEYEYFKAKSSEKAGRVACDFRKLFLDKDKTYDILLRDSDIINIPPKRKMVNISGNIINPGLVNYIPDEDYHYYIERAGGFSYKARKGKVYIIKGSTGKWVKAKRSVKLDPGDAIWVPEKPDRDYWKFFKDTMLVLGNAATIYLVVKQATE
ncbi:MAG: SLBB domain-containing protein [candidate division Zixibacteria bacterium]|nr:SLBB domain-containing protein [candidate division Zixibacteria bacterium]